MEQKKRVVVDGPIDPGKYMEASLRVLHLLKQPTEYNQSLPRLFLDLIAEQQWSTLMVRVAQRTYSLQHKGASWYETPDKDKPALAEALKASAVVNLDNSRFKKNTPPEELAQMAKDNLPRWRGVILECRPNVVVCGGTFDVVWKALGESKIWDTFSTGMQYFPDPGNPAVLYIQMPHPSAMYPAAMMHTFLAASAPEILSKAGAH